MSLLSICFLINFRVNICYWYFNHMVVNQVHIYYNVNLIYIPAYSILFFEWFRSNYFSCTHPCCCLSMRNVHSLEMTKTLKKIPFHEKTDFNFFSYLSLILMFALLHKEEYEIRNKHFKLLNELIPLICFLITKDLKATPKAFITRK